MRNKIAKRLRKAARMMKTLEPRASVKRTTKNLKRLHMELPKTERYYELWNFLLSLKARIDNENKQQSEG